MTDPTGSAPTFADLGLHPSLLAVLDDLGYEEPTGIQAEAIPALLAGSDLLGQAATGTGKTAAFSLPLLQRLAEGTGRTARGPLGLVLAPTRELAMQVAEAIHTYGQGIGVRVLPVYGGQPIVRQLKALDRGVDVVVATPGRALDHIARGSLDLSGVDVVVLDEADEMLDMGFVEDIDAILADVRDDAQTMLFSATMPRRIATLAADHLTDPVRVTVRGDSPAGGENPQIREVVYVVPRHHKVAALARILDVESPDSAIVFCRTRVEVDELTRAMNARGYRAEALHGGIDQQGRDRVMGHLRDGTTELLVATDVAARGLDVDTLTHVVNHSLPQSPEGYVHRIGRVGRAGRTGTAITLVAPREHRALRVVERHTGRTMEVETVPTVADLRARRLGLLTASVREAALGDDLESFRGVVEALAEEFDPVQIALAAVKVAHDETVGDEEAEGPERLDASLADDRGGRAPSGTKSSGGARGSKGGPPPSHATRLWVSLGRNAGMRPKDLVGAIAGETSLTGRDVGAIHIAQRFSLVDVPAESADEVIAALRATRMRGTKATVRRDKT
ncbi:DEAD/DEAH box helicase [Euzebya sp.]|uniref:DEAD/DEAH box helicase n=1 Tax=Euzebya sp. TaxID=1971409 RepID=UPI003510E455